MIKKSIIGFTPKNKQEKYRARNTEHSSVKSNMSAIHAEGKPDVKDQ